MRSAAYLLCSRWQSLCSVWRCGLTDLPESWVRNDPSTAVDGLESPLRGPCLYAGGLPISYRGPASVRGTPSTGQFAENDSSEPASITLTQRPGKDGSQNKNCVHLVRFQPPEVWNRAKLSADQRTVGAGEKPHSHSVQRLNEDQRFNGERLVDKNAAGTKLCPPATCPYRLPSAQRGARIRATFGRARTVMDRSGPARG